MIRTEVSFVLLLRDDFNGETITDGGHLFWVDGRPVQPIRKAEGYYVFTEPRAPCRLTVQSARHSTESLQLDPALLDPADPVLTLRLLRRGDLSFPGCGRLEGVGPPGRPVFALAEEDPPLVLREVRGDVLILEGYTSRRLCRLRFAVGTGKHRELLTPAQRLEDGSYRLERPPAFRHKEGEPILRAYAARCDPQGRFAVQVDRDALERVREVTCCEGEGKPWKPVSVSLGN